MKNKEYIKIPIPRLTWKLILAIILIILVLKLDPNKGYEILKDIFGKI